MPLPACNPWPANTVRQSDQTIACRGNSARAADYQLLAPNFLLAVADALQRLAVAGVEGFQNLSAFNVCDGEANAHNAACAINNISPPVNFNDAETQQVILWQLANALCANQA